MSEARKLAKDSFYVMGARAVSILSSLAMGIILARALGKDMYGLVTWAIFLEGIVFIFVDIGIQEASARRIAGYRATGKDVSGIVVSSAALKIIMGMAFTFLCLLFSAYIATALNSHPLATISVYACAALLFLDTISTAIYSSLYGFREMTVTSYAEVVQNVSKTVLAILLVALGFGLQGALIGLVAGSALLLVFYVYSFVKTVLPEIKSWRISFPEVRYVLTYGFFLGVSWAVVKIYMSFDQFYIGAALTMGDFVCYAIAMSLALLIYYAVFSLRRVLLTSFSRSSDTGDSGMTNKVFRLSVKYIAMIALPAGAGLAVLSTEVISAIYGYEYIAAAAVLPLLAMMGAIKTCELPGISLLDGTGKARSGARIAIVIMAANIALNLVLIPMFGIVGAAAASLVTLGGGAAAYLYVAARINGLKLPVKDLSLIALASLAMAASVYAIKLVLYSSGGDPGSFLFCLTVIVACIPSGMLVYAISILVLGVISPEDGAMIKKAAGAGRLSKHVIKIIDLAGRVSSVTTRVLRIGQRS